MRNSIGALLCGAVSITLLAFPLVGKAGGAKMIGGELSVHPEHISRDTRFLILFKQDLRNFCTSEPSLQVTTTSIDITVSPMPDSACTEDRIAASTRLMSPVDVVGPSYPFADSIEVRSLLVSDNEVTILETRQIAFSEVQNPPARIQSGSWLVGELGSSSVFVDQQDGIMSAALLDYDLNGQSTWAYTSGELAGNTFSADLKRYRESICALPNCDRANPEEAGHVYMLLHEANELIVQYDSASFSDQIKTGSAYTYRRIDFARSPEAQEIDRTGALLPDLVGEWVGGFTGVEGDPDRPAVFQALHLEYLGPSSISINEHSFLAFSGTGRSPIIAPVFPSGDVLFSITCVDRRPETEATQCYVLNVLSLRVEACIAQFELGSVEHDRVSADAVCVDGEEGRHLTRFEMFKLN